jgi:hypothetical protein
VDELYIIARRVLLDALEALGNHREATIVVGAQAIYLHTGDAELAVAEYTTGADLVLDPTLLGEIPPLEQAFTTAGFLHQGSRGVGVWKTSRQSTDAGSVEVQVDLLVPSAVSPGRGRRAARLPGHDTTAARKVDGLEGALVDQAQMEVGSLEPEIDGRRIATKVAGPGALLVARLFKIAERQGTARSNDKDALDVMRLLVGVETDVLAASLRRIMADERSGSVGERATKLFEELFGSRGTEGTVVVARAASPMMDENQVRLITQELARDLLAALAKP